MYDGAHNLLGIVGDEPHWKADYREMGGTRIKKETEVS